MGKVIGAGFACLDQLLLWRDASAPVVGNDLVDFDTLAAELQPLIDKVWRHCEDKGSRGRTATLKVKFADFEIITRSRSVPSPCRAATNSNVWPSACCRPTQIAVHGTVVMPRVHAMARSGKP